MFYYIRAFFWLLNSMTFNVSYINSRWIVVSDCFYRISSLWINRLLSTYSFLCRVFSGQWYFFLFFLLLHSKHSLKKVKSSFKEIIYFILRFSFYLFLNQNLTSLKIDLISLNNLSNYRSNVWLLS